MSLTHAPRSSPVLDSLVELFYPSPAQLGRFQQTSTQQAPSVYRQLLSHHQHMTVTVESFHGRPVDVKVLDIHQTKTHYARKILLTRKSDGAVVQFGIVRLCLSFLPEEVQQQIEDQHVPLGRILIDHGVLRDVQLISLWKITPGEELRELFGLEKPTTTYGRTALIYCNGVPAVELLEIVTPV